MLTGIMEIAGTDSELIGYIKITGDLLMIAAAVFQTEASLSGEVNEL